MADLDLDAIFAVDQVIDFDDGARVRIDRIADGQVYFVAWRRGEETGSPRRMPEATFAKAVEMYRTRNDPEPDHE